MSFWYEIQYEWCNIFLSYILTSQLTFCLKYLASIRLLHKKKTISLLTAEVPKKLNIPVVE